jgi:hypothetical protein
VNQDPSRYIVLFAPWLLATLLADYPIVSFAVSWLGHFFILYIVFSQRINPLAFPVTIKEQVLHPLILNQLLFCGFSGISSIFYFLDVNGYYFLEKLPYKTPDPDLIRQTAVVQSYYVLAHAALVIGLYSFINRARKPQTWRVVLGKYPSISLLLVSGLAFAMRFAILNFEPLRQVVPMFDGLTLVSIVMSMALAIKEKNVIILSIVTPIFVTFIINAVLSGWKEEMLVPFLLLGFFLYSYFPKTVLIIAPFFAYIYFVYVPTFNAVFRNLNWVKGEDKTIAYQIALSETLNAEGEDIGSNNWEFFAYRLSEMDMFVRFTKVVPDKKPYYGLALPLQGLASIVPRALYKEKAHTEQQVMRRVYDSGIVDAQSSVSAKPAFVADCYLAGGILGILIGCFCLGSIISFITRQLDEWYGGYALGTGLMYNAIFNELWRGNCIEFVVALMFWGFVVAYLLHYLAKFGKLIVPVNS